MVGVEDVNFLASRVNCMPLQENNKKAQDFSSTVKKNVSLSSAGIQNLYRFAELTSVVCLQNYFLVRMQRGAL